MILAIDLGSTTFKAGLFDRRLRQTASGSAPLRYRYASGGRVELDIAGVEAAFRRVLPRTRGIKAIAITSQAQTFTVLDRPGRPTRPFVSWQDGRATAAAARLARRLPDFAEHCSFPTVLPALLVSQLHHQPVQRGEWVMPLPTYFVRLLTGEAVLDDNLAAMSGLYSLKLRDWWPAVVRYGSLPRVAPIGSVAGLTQRNRFGLPVGIPVVLAGNDQTAGAYGARLHENGDVLLTLGTAQVAYQCLARPPAARAGLVRGPFFGGRFYRLAVTGAGGNLINWAQTVIRGCATNTQFFATASRAPVGSHGLVFEANVTGGVWRNVSGQHTAADLARSVVEGVSRELGGQVAGFGRLPRQRRLWVAGGGSRRSLWVKSVAAAIGRELQVTAATPLLGAARAAKGCRSTTVAEV